MLVKAEVSPAWAHQLGWGDKEIADVLDINIGSDVPDSPDALCPRCRREPVEYKIRLFTYDAATETAESISGRCYVSCICGHSYSYAVLDMMDARTTTGQSHVPAAVATPAVTPPQSVPPLSRWVSAEQWFERGFGAHDREERIRCYTEAIRLKPDHAEAYNNRGLARLDKGDPDGAIADCTEAIDLEPDAIPYNNRGLAHRDKGDLDGALADYTEAIRLKPDYARAYNNRGLVRSVKGDRDGAIADYTEAIRHKPDPYGQHPDLHARAYNNRGLAHHDKGDLDGALADYTEAIRLKPDYAMAYYNRAQVRKTMGQRDLAIADYHRYLDLGEGGRHGDQAEVERIIRDLMK